LIGPVIGGFIACGIGFWLQSHRRVKDSKDVFGVFIQGKISELPKRSVGDFYTRTKPAISAEVHRVWHFLAEDKRTRLDILWREYDQIPAQDLDSKNEGAMGEAMRDLCKRAIPPSEFKTPYEIIRRHLDEFYKCAA
jgi:hypothetical protein